MYEKTITELEKALYAKTKEAEEAVNVAANVEWRNIVKCMLEYDTASKNHLADQLKKAMTLISSLQVNISQLIYHTFL